MDKNDAALASLRLQGYDVGEQAIHPGGVVKVGIRTKDESAWVELGQQLWDLAAGRLTLAQIREGATMGGPSAPKDVPEKTVADEGDPGGD